MKPTLDRFRKQEEPNYGHLRGRFIAELEVHALSELAIARAAQTTGLSLQDLLKPSADMATDEKGLAKLRFLDEIVAVALVGDESERLTADEL